VASLQTIIELGKKELRSIWHDKVLVIMVVWAFSGGIYAMAAASSFELHNTPIAFVDMDQSQLTGRFRQAFLPPYFMRAEEIGLEQVDQVLDAGRYTFVLIFPEGLEADIRAGKQPDIQINVDATRMAQAFIGASYIQNILAREITTQLQRSDQVTRLPINAVTRLKFNPNGVSSWFGGVMEIINNITMLSIILTGAALIREREHGTIEHLLVMPVSAFEIMIAKVLASAVIVLLAASLSLLLIIQGALAVPIAGSVPLFLGGAALYLFSTCSIGIFLGTVARSMPQLGLLLILTLLPLQMLSGGVTPRESMPDLVQHIMLLAPTTHFVSLAQAILYRGAGFAIVWPQFLAVLGIGIVFFSIALARLRSSLSRL
jgi:ABC-2 type transport system permease protein